MKFKKSFFKNFNKNYWRLITTESKFLKGFLGLFFSYSLGWVVYCLAYSFVVGLGLSRFRGLVSFPL
ncbi:hypothetical protein B0X62_03565 [Helicobacter pylori]|nr:hypothetical protein B0X62_03565 [Helicobacter pylori]